MVDANHPDWLFYKRAKWKYSFAILPHVCEMTKKRLWFEHAYKGVALYTGPGDDVVEIKWLSRDQFLIAKLKGLL